MMVRSLIELDLLNALHLFCFLLGHEEVVKVKGKGNVVQAHNMFNFCLTFHLHQQAPVIMSAVTMKGLKVERAKPVEVIIREITLSIGSNCIL
jgi:hypothetical protein